MIATPGTGRRSRGGDTTVFRQNTEREADNLADQRLRPGIVERAFQTGKVTAGNMADFMRQNADDLPGPFGGHQQPAGDENTLTTGHKSVKRPVVDDVKAKIPLFDSSGAQKWRSGKSEWYVRFPHRGFRRPAQGRMPARQTAI